MPEISDRLRVLIVAPYLNGEGLGEVYSIFNWVKALAEEVDATVLSVNNGKINLAEQLPSAHVVQFSEPKWFDERFRKLNMSAKPWIPVFFGQARRWIKREMASSTVTWDIAHQMLPQAMRYASPLRGLGLPYVVGPLGGSLETPPGFQGEVESGGVLMQLRGLDRWRLRNDPWLRHGYEDASLILGVAPYVAETLDETGVRIRRFESVLERAHEDAFPEVTRTSGAGEAHLLHVGRGVRTKGLRDVVRALAQLGDLPGVRLTSAGDGPEIAAAQVEAEALGVADRVTFLGRVPRVKVDELYAEADVFCFPSFREPMGGVFFEAMEWSLPVIAADRGGPAFILDNASAIKLPVETPDQFRDAIAGAIRTLAMDPDLRQRMGAASATRLRNVGSWHAKAEHLVALYREVIATSPSAALEQADR